MVPGKGGWFSFHTPCGVTWFLTMPIWRSGRRGRFPYALWRDLVSDVVIVLVLLGVVL